MAAIWSNPDFQFVLWAMVKIVVILFTMLTVVSYMIYAERKIAGHMQARVGPNRVGPLGLLQPAADVLKLFFKEEFTPEGASKVIFHIAPMMAVIPALVTFSVIPFGPQQALRVTDVNVGLLVFLAMSSLGVYAITLGGWSSNNKYALLGGLRSSAQMISYELAQGISLVSVIVMTGTLSLASIVRQQEHLWFIVPQFFAFVIYILCGIAETNRAPFDLAEAETELVAGFHTEFSSMKFALYFLAEYANMMVVSGIAISVFFGGWHGPFLPPVVWFLIKLSLFLFFYVWLRATFPRLRYDQLMAFGWKVLLPASLLNLTVTALVVGLTA